LADARLPGVARNDALQRFIQDLALFGADTRILQLAWEQVALGDFDLSSSL